MRNVLGASVLLVVLGSACSQVFVQGTQGSAGSGGAAASSTDLAAGSGGPSASATAGGGTNLMTVVSSSSTGSEPQICPSFQEPCSGCVATQCAETWCDCQGNAECFALFACVSGCMDAPGCNEDCMTQHPEGIAALLAVSGCAGTTCDAACPWGAEDHTPCAGCVFKDCASETNACFGKTDCFALWKCFDTCGPGSLSCHKQCYDDYPDGIVELEALLGCTNTVCSELCG